MADGAAINRELNDAERQLLADLAVQEVVKQTHCSIELARDVLLELANKGELLFVGDYTSVRVENANGGFLVEAARDWLSWHASGFGGDGDRDRADDVVGGDDVHQHDDRGVGDVSDDAIDHRDGDVGDDAGPSR